MRKKEHSARQSFLQGALILMLANAVVKLIGAIFKIPLKNLIGADGIGIFNTAYTNYAFFLTLATAGIPVAVSRMVAEANALGKAREIRNIFRISFIILISVGTVFTAAMYFLAEPLVIKVNSRADLSVIAFAPALLFTAISSAYRGYYQGLGNMKPTAMSQVVEALAKLIFGYTLAYGAIKLGYDVKIASAAAVTGVTLSTVAGALYLFIISKVKKTFSPISSQTFTSRPKGDIARQIRNIAIPITIAMGIMSLTNYIDMFVIQGRLQDIGYTEGAASSLYGIYETMCISLMNLPQTLIAAVTVSLIPVIAASLAQANTERARHTTESAMRLGSLLAFPCAVGMFVLTGPILNLLFSEDVATATPLLRALAFNTLFVAYVYITNSILQATGNEKVTLYSSLVGGAVKFTVNYILIGIPSIGISGAPMGTILCYVTICAINFIYLHRKTDVSPKRWGSILKPAAAGAVMGAVCWLIYPWLMGMLGAKVGVLVDILICAVVYLIALIAVRGFYKEDVMMLPGGKKLVNLFKLK